MGTVLLTIHVLVAVALIGIILVQKSEGGGLGIGGGAGGGMSGFLTGRAQANLLTRTTSYLAAIFFLVSIGLAWYAGAHRSPRSVIDTVPAAPLEAPAVPAAPAPPR